MAAILHLGNLEFKGNGQTQSSFEDPEQARVVAKVHIYITCMDMSILVFLVHLS